VGVNELHVQSDILAVQAIYEAIPHAPIESTLYIPDSSALSNMIMPFQGYMIRRLKSQQQRAVLKVWECHSERSEESPD
jgi:hypothetical protein